MLEVLALPFTALAALWLKLLRRIGLRSLPVSRALFSSIGVLPVRHHYYEPYTIARDLRLSLDADRPLPGIDLDVAGQLALLSRFAYAGELLQFPVHRTGRNEFHYANSTFGAGDAEYLYNVIRHFRPRRILEIGSGSSTLMARNAIRRNQQEDSAYECEHVCIEPFEQPWLEELGIPVVRQRVEELGVVTFERLAANDVLFIDSSHVVRPQGDILFEYLEVLPRLRPGVLVHIHDMFTPRDYPQQWLLEDVRLWNEQYLVEAFLSFNREFRVIAALNFLKHHFPTELSACCPMLGRSLPDCEPGSFWIVKCRA